MKEIGGYFELELGKKKNSLFSEEAIYVNSGRNAFEYILRSLPKIDTLWMPYFTCSSLQEPLSRLKVHVRYYQVTEQLEIQSVDKLNLGSTDYILYTNYFGVKENYALTLYSKFGSQLIIDNSQALFAKPTELCFYSPRKFVGVPDGGVAFSPFKMDIKEQDKSSYLRCTHLLKRFDHAASEGYSDFKIISETIANQPLLRMSNLTRRILDSIDFNEIINQRKLNFSIIHQELQPTNQLSLDSDISGALVYPYLNKNRSTLKNELIENKVYVATYWPNILLKQPSSSIEYQLTSLLVNIPIDQRYTAEDIFKMLSLI